jgi:hypothetical protein
MEVLRSEDIYHSKTVVIRIDGVYASIGNGLSSPYGYPMKPISSISRSPSTHSQSKTSR